MSTRTILAATAAVALAASIASAEVWRAGLKAGIISGSSTLNETDYPTAELTLAEPVLGPVCSTNRVTNAANASTDMSVIWYRQRTWVYWGQMWFDGGAYRFASWMYDPMLVKIDGEVVFRQTATAPNNIVAIGKMVAPSRGWHDVEFRFVNNDNAYAGPYCSAYTCRGWSATHGFGVSTLNAASPSSVGDDYHYPEDDGTGSLFRHDAEADGATVSNVTFDHGASPYPAATLSFAAGPHGSVSTPGGTCAFESSITVTATPDSGYRFVRWEGAEVPEGVTFSQTAVVPGTRNWSLTALFGEIAPRTAKAFTGATGGSWGTASNWTPAGVPDATCDVFIPASRQVNLDVYADIGSLVISNNSVVSAAHASGKLNAIPRDVASTADASTIGIDARGNVTLLGSAKLYIGGRRQNGQARLAVKGDLSLAGSSCAVAIHAGRTNGVDLAWMKFRRGGARVVVGGATTIASGAVFYPYSHNAEPPNGVAGATEQNTGNPVVFDLGDLNVAAGGSINASGLGYLHTWQDSPLLEGTRSASQLFGLALGGGGHGGRSGATSAGKVCTVYGHALAPSAPGSSNVGSQGGGAVRIFARNVVLDGTVDARSSRNFNSFRGAGGSIWITADALSGSGALKADANFENPYTIGDYSMWVFSPSQTVTAGVGGGGGRVAVGLGLSPAQIDEICMRGTLLDGSVVTGSVAAVTGSAVAASAGPSPGGMYNAACDGEAGTVVAYTAVLAGAVAVSDSLNGLSVVASGTDLAGTSVADPWLSADGTERRAVTGYEVAMGGASVSGAGNEVAGPLLATSDATVAWSLAAPEYRAACSAIGDGAATVSCDWTAPGGDFTIAATAATAGKEFQYWLGDVPYAKRFDNPLIVPATNGFRAVAFFANDAAHGATCNSLDTTDNLEWYNPSHWKEGVVPGTNDVAVVKSASTMRGMVVNPGYAAVKELQVNKTYLFVGACRGANTPGATAITRSALPTTAKDAQNAARRYAADIYRTEPIGLDVSGDVTVSNTGWIHLGGMEQNSPLKVSIGGDLTIQSGCVAAAAGYDLTEAPDPTAPRYIAIPVADYLYGENVFKVAGATTISSGAYLWPFCEYRSGVPVRFEMADVTVASGGYLFAGMGGFERGWVQNGRRYTSCPGGVAISDNRHGGSYGGVGGGGSANSESLYFTAYGCENAPHYPGSSSGTWRDGQRGGGLIRLDADSLTLEGSLTATGPMPTQKGAAAGGGILVNVGEFTPGESCLVSVRGTDGKEGSGGGGGRAAICVGLTREQMFALATNETHEAEGATVSPLADYLTTRFDCAGGAASSTATYSDGTAGTGVYIVNTAGSVTLTVAGEPANVGVVAPVYGVNVYESGERIEAAAPTEVVVSGDGRSRRVNGGWWLVDENGGAIARGATTNAVFTLDQNAVLTWRWTLLQHEVSLGANGGGHLVTNAIDEAGSLWQEDGTVFSVTAVADAGSVFVGWYGDVPATNRTDATLSLVAWEGRDITALFAPSASGSRVWQGAEREGVATGGDGSSWEDPLNWLPNGVPGVREDVTIPAGAAVVAERGVEVAVGSLTVESGASLAVRGTAFSTERTLVAEAAEGDWLPSVMTIDGDLVVAGELALGRVNSLSEPTLAVSGSLLVENGGALRVNAAYKDIRHSTTNGWWEGGGAVRVAGATRVASGGWIYPWCNPLSGAPVVFRLGSLRIAEGGGFNAVSRGWSYSSIGSAGAWLSLAPAVVNNNDYAGATHAGYGVASHSPNGMNALSYCTAYGAPYGDPLAPYMPGCTARVWDTANVRTGNGGGAIRIFATGPVACDGVVTADGGTTGGSDYGAGSGGAVWLSSEASVKLGATASVTARGGDSTWSELRDGAPSGGAPAGGGRVLVTEYLREADLEELFATHALTRAGCAVLADADEIAALANGATVSADGGIYTHGDFAERFFSGQDGTVRWIRGPARRTMFIIK